MPTGVARSYALSGLQPEEGSGVVLLSGSAALSGDDVPSYDVSGRWPDSGFATVVPVSGDDATIW